MKQNLFIIKEKTEIEVHSMYAINKINEVK